MIFIIPVILGAAALLTAGTGVVVGVDGLSKIEEAKKLGKNAQKKYEREQKIIQNTLQQTQELAEEYGQMQIQVKLQTIERFITFIEQIGQKASQSDMAFLTGLEGASPQQIQEYKTAVLEVKRFATGGIKAAGAAGAAYQGTVALIGLFGTASTGTAIGGLSGAAAWNATLAWLGGGSLAAGGGGMALGTLVLGGITVGPALMVGGFVLGGQGEKALTEAHRYVSQVNTEIAKLHAYKDFLGQVQQRIIELGDIVNRLNNEALDEFMKLESQVIRRSSVWIKDEEKFDLGVIDFNRERDAEQFQKVALLIKALVTIMKIPVLDAEGNLNQDTVKLKEKY